jgi:TolB-like protein/class 3 adenylate cyclase/DNA-binding winged helix-turn-helix (wHTH) protein/Tfp pilus assembly protein PilF
MEALASSEVFLFDDFRLDWRGGGLFRRDDNGTFAPVAVGSRGLDILGVLIARAGEVVSKDEIIAAVWPGTVVEDSNLTVQVSALRRVLDRDRANGSCIQTVSGRGYRFVGVVVQPGLEEQSAPSPNDSGGATPLPIDASMGRPLSRPFLSTAGSSRRLVAILALDVAGYSRLMGADEEGTHERLKTHHRQLVEPKIREHRGRIVKTTGDGMLAEFHSVVDAVRCAAEVQRGMIDREPEIPDDQRIKFRIGINLGDVIAERGDIFGDGVNVAARLEALAEAGGICVSGVVRDQIRDKLPLLLDDRGEQNVKNIARPIRVYALGPEAIAELPASSMAFSTPRRRPVVGPSIAAAIAMVLALGAGAWWLWPATKRSPAPETAAAATSISEPFVAPRLSIVVLPFANLSNDPDQQYFADGMTDDLTTDLSRIAHVLVIARNTAFTYRNKPIAAKQIGRELGVRYLLEGSLQRSSNQVRINAQLIDAESDAHLWAERLDGDASDLFALQNEITTRIAVALNQELVAAEASRRTENPDVLEYILRARAAGAKPPSLHRSIELISLLEHALALDPHSSEAQSALAAALAGRVLNGLSDSPAADLERAKALSEQALAASPRSLTAHIAKGQVLRAQRHYAEAILEYETALAYNRNYVYAYFALGQCKLYTGSIEETIPLIERAIRLSPRDPELGVFYEQIGIVHLLQSRTNQAIIWLEKARNHTPAHPVIRADLAAAYALAGDTERAAVELAEARRLSPDDRYSSIARLKAIRNYGVLLPNIRALFEATYLEGLREAGMPEE